jgi:cytochrome c
LFFEVLGYIKKNEDYDKLSLEIAKTTTVNKSMAVVMGVAPLLTINTLYTVYFYTANALTGLMWIMIIPLVIVAFLLLYAHKYSYEILKNNKPLHIAIVAMASALFLFIPLIFLTNINLMLLPEKWAMVKGFASALTLPNVWPRYFHFIFASLAVTGLFLFWWVGRKSLELNAIFKTITLYDLRKRFYSITFFASISQFIIGPMVLLTLPEKGLSWQMIMVILTGASLAVPALIYIWKELTGAPELLGKRFHIIALLITLTVVFMGYGRHLYRATSLAPHQKLVKKKTELYVKQVKEATLEANKPKPIETNKAPLSAGEMVFENNCKACHDLNEKVVGPSFKEAAQIYKGNKAGIMQWIKKPGKKREGPPMPAQSHLSDKEVSDVADWILGLK